MSDLECRKCGPDTAAPGQALYEAIRDAFPEDDYVPWDDLGADAQARYGQVAAQEPHAAPDTPGSVGRPGDSDAGQIDIGNRQNGPHAAPELATLLADWRKTADSLKDRRGVGDARERNTLEVVIGQVEAILAREPQPAPELANQVYRGDRLEGQLEDVRAVVAEILDAFGPSGSGHTARVGMVQIAKWRTRAGLTS
jgi:hypothetical protein